jgi:predicted RNA methylase
MKLKHLESALQDVTLYSQLDASSARIELEQYSTSPHLAARMVYTAHMEYDDIEDRSGCATLAMRSFNAQSLVVCHADKSCLFMTNNVVHCLDHQMYT